MGTYCLKVINIFKSMVIIDFFVDVIKLTEYNFDFF